MKYIETQLRIASKQDEINNKADMDPIEAILEESKETLQTKTDF